MAQAAAAGVVDFTQADPLSPRWQRRLAWLLEAFRTARLAEVSAARRQTLLAVIASGTLDGEGARRTAEDLRVVTAEFIARTLPWVQQPDMRQRFMQAKDRWMAIFGSLDDPAVQARLDATIAWLERGNLPARKAP